MTNFSALLQKSFWKLYSLHDLSKILSSACISHIPSNLGLATLNRRLTISKHVFSSLTLAWFYSSVINSEYKSFLLLYFSLCQNSHIDLVQASPSSSESLGGKLCNDRTLQVIGNYKNIRVTKYACLQFRGSIKTTIHATVFRITKPQ